MKKRIHQAAVLLAALFLFLFPTAAHADAFTTKAAKELTGSKVVEYAMNFVGFTPYVQGSYSLYEGTDCAGFLWLIFGAFGISVPGGVAPYQQFVGRHITYEELMPGDIVVYAYGEHVALYAGNGEVIHCSCPECGTVRWRMDYRNDATAYLRVIDEDINEE